MKKLNIANGGMPLEGDDLTYAQTGYVEAISAICEGLGGDKTAVFGCEITFLGENISVADGWIYFDGELCQFTGGTADGFAQDLNRVFIEVEDYYDPAGVEIYADALSKNTYVNKRLKLTHWRTDYESPSTSFFTLDELSYLNSLKNTEPALNIGTAGDVRITSNYGIVTVVGCLTATKIGDPSFTIPRGFRPSQKLSFLASLEGTNGVVSESDFVEYFVDESIIAGTIDENGVVKFRGIDNSAGQPNVTLGSINHGKLSFSFSYLK